jgi:molecular chaperone DnaK
MSQEEIDKAVKDAERFAEEDKKAKEAVDTRNHAESLIFQSEKTLGELGDKVDAADTQPVKDAIEKLRETLKGNDIEAIKADTAAVEQAFYKVSEKLYAQQGGAQADPNGGAQGDGTYYNANFEDHSES